MRRVVGTLAVLFFAAHFAFLPQTLDDIDAVNFAMGVRDFDVAQHQPHPPGYPVFIALAKLSTAALAATGVTAPDVRGLAILSALGGAALVLLLFVFFRALDGDVLRAFIATVLTMSAPLVWFNAARPLSDVAGLAAAFAALAALAVAMEWTVGAGAPAPPSSTRLAAIAGALLAGIAIGFRSQMAMLTVPTLAVALIRVRRHRLVMVAAVLAGIAAWAVPLVWASGGLAGYARALRSQAGEDFTGVVMLWTNPSPRTAFAAVLDTFVHPWDSPILAGIVLSLAAAGTMVLALAARRTLLLVLLTFAPYAFFHLFFQEFVTTRYALPLVPPIAYLAATTVAAAPIRAALALAGGIAIASLSFAVPATIAYGTQPSPIFALLSETKMLQARGAQPTVGVHRRVFTESRRARAYAGGLPGSLLAAPRDYEWLEMTRAWKEGAREAWFIADPRRTDLALVDRTHARTRKYRWPFNAAVYAGGARPNEVDWYIFGEPGWFLEQGWALTPETAGISDRDGWGPHRRPSVGWIRRRGGDAFMTIGGRHLGGDPPVTVTVAIDARPIAEFVVKPGYFLESVNIPAGAVTPGDGYAALTVAAHAAGGTTPPLAIEQFDFQPADHVQFGYDAGWFEPEYNPATAKSWRWMSERALVRVHHAGQPVVLRLTGESPLRYFSTAPTLRISAGDRVLAELSPSSDFSAEVRIPADALDAAHGRITLTSDRAFVAGEREGTADRRRLALRIYSLAVEAAGR
ncbi:MAG TPA: DUF2723 domain-containing protein [Vicinamibacterales bacterium]|nr:DUF2723 domain-containing protein [Vicinamibacterales bacterium]